MADPMQKVPGWINVVMVGGAFATLLWRARRRSL